jgi:hypothetical protein
LLTLFRESASYTPTRFPRHLNCGKARPRASTAAANCRQVQHWTRDLAGRVAEHAQGRGARLLEVVGEAGIGWRLARTWEGGRDRERQLKTRAAFPAAAPSAA